MLTHAIRQRIADLLDRRAARPEAGSLVLDILIGMAIFALIAIIAVSAVGQYRMRAYTQTAMSDAEQVANAVNAHLTDLATNGADERDGSLPYGPLDDSILDGLGMTGTERSTFLLSSSTASSSPEDFEVCVEHRGAYAIYDSAAGGLTESGSMDRDGFRGCDAVNPPGPPASSFTTSADCENAGYIWQPGAIEIDEMRDATGAQRDGQWYLPWEVGFSQASWPHDWWDDGTGGYMVDQSTGLVSQRGDVVKYRFYVPGSDDFCWDGNDY